MIEYKLENLYNLVNLSLCNEQTKDKTLVKNAKGNSQKMKTFFKKLFIFFKKPIQVFRDRYQYLFHKITLNLQYSDVLIKHL